MDSINEQVLQLSDGPREVAIDLLWTISHLGALDTSFKRRCSMSWDTDVYAGSSPWFWTIKFPLGIGINLVATVVNGVDSLSLEFCD